MKSFALITAAQLLSAVSTVTAIQLSRRDNPRVFGLDIQRQHVPNPVTRERLYRRQKFVRQTLDNLETLYFANASLGTPEQQLRLHIDTGSSDLWVNADNSTFCDDSDQCEEGGTYDPEESSSFEYVNSAFNITYVDGTGASGIYAKDTFHFGGTSLEDLQFGVGYTSSSAAGILGIGYVSNEAQVHRAGLEPYPNLPQLLVDRGYINSNAYSLWLNDLDASRGSILFGGVDTEKFQGTLHTLPIIPNRQTGEYLELVISLTGLGQNGNEGSIFSAENNDAITDIISFPVLLDSGASLTYLPDDIVRYLYYDFGGEYDSSAGVAYIDCDFANQQGSLDFTFSGITISVPYNELVLEAGTRRGQPVCVLGVAPSGNEQPTLGDTFLRSAYVVYDLSNNEISLAPTNFNATQSAIQEIQSGEDGVPDASGVPGAVSTGVVGPTGSGFVPLPSPTKQGGAAGLTPELWMFDSSL
ncbi:acid protease [Sporormia fimetaria CBS 119925]|uniref:Probable aspartic-type endopeptidase OPSB n=1 Tax=Sporormia fimetaria CBS 119925 TaxID=1340428 RepID=A0A6A6V2A5_9PLEO|nr:acid protease [Sporormia fimetaria CBS 119925]